MNFAHIHLIVNHIPLLTIPVSLIFFAYSIFRSDRGLRRFSLLVLIATTATALPVYYTGEPAEKIVEYLPGISEHAIEEHEEAAEFALITTLITGALAAATLVLSDREKLKKPLSATLIISCIISVGSLGYAANLGGKIHHEEASDSTSRQGK